MSWRVTHKNLRAKLVKKLASSESAFDQRIMRLAKSKSISPAAAIYVLAQQEGIQATRDFQKLSDTDRSSVQGLRLSKSTATRTVNNSKSQVDTQSNLEPSVRELQAKRKKRAIINHDNKKGWHETWWGLVIIGVVVTVVGGLILLRITHKSP